MSYKLGFYKDDKIEIRIENDEIGFECFTEKVNSEDIDFAFKVIKHIEKALKEAEDK
jgi:hypothetical protein